MNTGKNPKSKKALVAMSGGVDSSVAAALLKKRGYFVVGVFMKFWSEARKSAVTQTDWRGNENRCCSGEAYESAKSVCAKLDIPFRALDCRREFKKKVVDYFISEYAAGRTPNPCVRCNEKIKFKLLLETAKKWGMEFVATGHYVRLRREIRNPKSEIRNKSQIQNSKQKKLEIGNWKLEIARDSAKDQSYFLYNLTQRQLQRILFPLGDYTKEEVRNLAEKWGLPTAERPESFEVCFVPDRRVADFLARHIKAKPGKIVDEKGRYIGEHKGLPFYTIGQRHGLGDIKGVGPFYVIAKNPAKNELVVTNNLRSPLLWRKELIVKEVSWISGKIPKTPLKCKVKIRYRHKAAFAVINKIQNKKYKIRFSRPQKAITPGQSAVFYSGHEVLGGGVIV